MLQRSSISAIKLFFFILYFIGVVAASLGSGHIQRSLTVRLKIRKSVTQSYYINESNFTVDLFPNASSLNFHSHN